MIKLWFSLIYFNTKQLEYNRKLIVQVRTKKKLKKTCYLLLIMQNKINTN